MMCDTSSSLDSQGSIVNPKADKDCSPLSKYDVDYIKSESYDEPDSEPHFSPYDEQYTDIVRYTPQFLTLLEPYKQDSAPSSPPMYAKMNPVAYGERLEVLNDDAAVVPSSILSAEERGPQDGSSSPVEDYRNLSTITPTLFEMKKEKPIFFPEDMESVASSSSPASSTSHGSWLQSTQIDDPRYQVLNDSPTDITKDYPDAPGVWQCVNCATVSSDTGVWWPDETGHYLCDNCSKLRNFFNVSVPDKVSRHKSLEVNNDRHVLNKLNSLPTRFHHRVNGIKKVNQICSNCQTSSTSLWRRSAFGETVCNACGLYYKLHKRNRPITMRKDNIQKRKRKPKTQSSKKFLPHTLPSKFENDEINSPISSTPPSYNSHLAALNGISRESGSTGTHQTFNSVGLSLPPVHSPDGFSTQLSHFNSPSVSSHSCSPPTLESYNSSYISASNCTYPNYGSISSSTSPTIASLLQSSHSYMPLGDHSPVNHTNLHSVYNL